MSYLRMFLELHIATQTALLCLYLMFSSKFDLFHVIYLHSPSYFYFLVIGFGCCAYIAFTYITKALGYNRVGVKADRASRSRGYK
jgi:hypothetical protein